MKRNSAVWLLAWVVCVWVAPAPGRAQEPAQPQGKHCLWQVQGKTNTVHLLGSIHFLKKEFYPLDAPIEAAYRRAQLVVFETDFTEMESPQAQLKFLQLGQCPAGRTLRDELSPPAYRALTNHLGGSGLPAGTLDGFKPWMAAVMLLGTELHKLGFDPEQGVDKYFFNKARQDRKAVAGLETLEFQLSLFNGFTQADSEAMLLETLAETARFQTMVLQLTAAWKSGDTQKIEALVFEDLLRYPQVYQKLIVERNQKWSAQIGAWLEQGKNALVVVGAGHLVGSGSVVELLRKKGYAVRQQ